ncbi:unnamed protein product [Symbiodinium sp. KB8]|nr:unnamed protein product [Symbiodinium sp. KB8]
MSKWIATMGTRVCSICRTKLPIAFAAQAPYIVLQVVRHMRGLHWSGEREYIVSFDGGGQAPGWMAGGAESVVVGSGSECHLSLPDPSLSRRHACISYDGRSFQLEDLSSSAGTFVRLETAVCLLPQSPSTFKIGRTTLTVEVVQGGHGLEVALPSIGSPAAAAATSQASSPAPSWWESRGRSSAVSPVSPTPPVFPMEAVSTLHDDTRQADGAPHLQDTAPNAVTSDTALPDHTQPHAAAGGSH